LMYLVDCSLRMGWTRRSRYLFSNSPITTHCRKLENTRSGRLRRSTIA
jgi:hypothetical protein